MVSGTHYESTPLSQERAKRLEDIGFVWKTCNPRRATWEELFKDLLEFKEKFGHVQVPMGYKNHPRLTNWVSEQRQERRALRLGKKPRNRRLTQERIAMLDEIGFVWEASPCSSSQKRKPKYHEGNKTNGAGGESEKAKRRKISVTQGSRDLPNEYTTVSKKGPPPKKRKKKPLSPLTYTNAADLHSGFCEQERSSRAPPFLLSQPEASFSVEPGTRVNEEHRVGATVSKKKGAPAKKRKKKKKPPSPPPYTSDAGGLDSESFGEDRSSAPSLLSSQPKPEVWVSPSSSMAPAPHVQQQERLMIIEDNAASALLRRHRDLPLLNGTSCFEQGRRLVPSTTPLSESNFHNSKDPLERLQLLQAEEERQIRLNRQLQLRRQALELPVPFRAGTSSGGRENVLPLIAAGLGISQTSRSNVHNRLETGGTIDDTPRMLATVRDVALLARLGLQDQARFDLGALVETCATNNNNDSHERRSSTLSTQEIPPESRFWEL